jgi:hypothetical protein
VFILVNSLSHHNQGFSFTSKIIHQVSFSGFVISVVIKSTHAIHNHKTSADLHAIFFISFETISLTSIIVHQVQIFEVHLSNTFSHAKGTDSKLNPFFHI